MQFSAIERQILAYPVEKFSSFYLTCPEFSLPCLPELDTGNYPDTNGNTSLHLTLFCRISSILLPNPRLVPRGIFRTFLQPAVLYTSVTSHTPCLAYPPYLTAKIKILIKECRMGNSGKLGADTYAAEKRKFFRSSRKFMRTCHFIASPVNAAFR